MPRKIIWTKRANKKFNKTIDYLEQEWGHRVTENFVKKSYDIIELISDQPDLGTIENQEKNIRGFLLTRHNRLFYRVSDSEIILLNFFDTRSGPKRKRYWRVAWNHWTVVCSMLRYNNTNVHAWSDSNIDWRFITLTGQPHAVQDSKTLNKIECRRLGTSYSTVVHFFGQRTEVPACGRLRQALL